MNFGSKTCQPRPPDKGSFPLDHFGECKSFKEKFMKCLRDNKFENALCRKESKAYLECRMEGIPGRCSGLAPAFGPGLDPGDPGSNPTSGSRCMEPASPSSSCVSACLSLSVTIINRMQNGEAADGPRTTGKTGIWRFDRWKTKGRNQLLKERRPPAPGGPEWSMSTVYS
uniref:Cytochrome c oxidase assembly protein COX19 n=2 Tax=Canis lupus familiaris TaxID=9615 RepID=A0A8I3Q729_CANLF